MSTKSDKTIDTPSIELGPRTSHSLLADPKHLAFVLSRYKFVAKMLEGKGTVLEVGCGDAFGSPVVAQAVDYLFCVDRDARLIEGNRKRLAVRTEIDFHVMDLVAGRPPMTFDAAYLLDVIEHLEPRSEGLFLENVCGCLSEDGVLIVGTPNITAVQHASEPGSSPHVNLKSHVSLRKSIDRLFVNTFLFSMNDEVVHTGFYPMAHYLFGVGVGKR
jgi:2-polyprenyl-3-methyl-5-hydroxy-6-metoxy-1,4-benzoquinol methylase